MKNSGQLGKDLIFLISQPRAGSTLLQRILGTHPSIATLGEPWLMLLPFYALRADGHSAEYDASLAWRAGQSFLQSLPGGDKVYYEGMRRMYTYLYDCAAAASGKTYFLDKTPRYYFIISDLYRTFPEARYIILLRNPLAVLNSILNTWSVFFLYRYEHDLLRAPLLLLDGIETLREQKTVVHYEQLVKEPENEVQRICKWLTLDFTPEMLEYDRQDTPKWRFGDKAGVCQYTHPVEQNVQRWVNALSDPQVWRLAYDYLHLLGPEIFEQLGYSFIELQETLAIHRPNILGRLCTFSLARWLRKPLKENSRWRRSFSRLTRSLQRRGFRDTITAGLQMMDRRHST